jgi:hypothetical protein
MKPSELMKALKSVKRTCANRRSFGYESCNECQYGAICDECFSPDPSSWQMPKQGKREHLW